MNMPTNKPVKLFEKIIGHKKNQQALWQAIAKKSLAHTFIFTGPSGVGKKKMAWALAQALVCEKDQAPCGICGSCVRIVKEQSENVLFIAPQTSQITSQIKVEQARDIQSFFYLANIGKARLCIIEEAHLLNPQASNALLKILEEPPVNSYFILITSNLNALLPTIRSRSQIVRFQPLSIEEMQQISDAPKWAIHASQGRMDQLEMLKSPDNKELREHALQILNSAFDEYGFETFSQLKSSLKDKSSTLFFVQTWQQIFRDGWLTKKGLTQVIHSDQVEMLKRISLLSAECLSKFCEQTLFMEQEILRNIDRTLLVEDFWLKLHSQTTVRA